MLTKKDKILVQPWIDARFRAHRDKVACAGIRIDVRPPAVQPHVTVKLKKTQRELERQRDIVRENGRLLQRLGQIMNHNRVDNFWRECRPKYVAAYVPIIRSQVDGYSSHSFLNREPINGTAIHRPQTASVVDARSSPASSSAPSSSASSVKSKSTLRSAKNASGSDASGNDKQHRRCHRCPTCSGRPIRSVQQIPEERVPWAPPRPTCNVKLSEVDGRPPARSCAMCSC